MALWIYYSLSRRNFNIYSKTKILIRWPNLITAGLDWTEAWVWRGLATSTWRCLWERPVGRPRETPGIEIYRFYRIRVKFRRKKMCFQFLTHKQCRIQFAGEEFFDLFLTCKPVLSSKTYSKSHVWYLLREQRPGNVNLDVEETSSLTSEEGAVRPRHR